MAEAGPRHEAEDKVQVAVRVRPLLGKEKDGPVGWSVQDGNISVAGGKGASYDFGEALFRGLGMCVWTHERLWCHRQRI